MNNKFLCGWTGYVSQYFVIFNIYILLYTQGNLIKNLAIFCALLTITKSHKLIFISAVR